MKTLTLSLSLTLIPYHNRQTSINVISNIPHHYKPESWPDLDPNPILDPIRSPTPDSNRCTKHTRCILPNPVLWTVNIWWWCHHVILSNCHWLGGSKLFYFVYSFHKPTVVTFRATVFYWPVYIFYRNKLYHNTETCVAKQYLHR